MTNISGNTYPVKDQLRALGGKWNPSIKAWMVPDKKAPAAQALVDEASVDNRTWKQIHGRCEDAPCCGCCGGNYYGEESW